MYIHIFSYVYTYIYIYICILFICIQACIQTSINISYYSFFSFGFKEIRNPCSDGLITSCSAYFRFCSQKRYWRTRPPHGTPFEVWIPTHDRCWRLQPPRIKNDTPYVLHGQTTTDDDDNGR